MAGYRAAFVGPDAAETIDQAHRPAQARSLMLRPLRGGDDRSARRRIRRSAEVAVPGPSRRLRPALEAAGFIDRSEGGLYLWATEGRDAWDSIGRLADLGIIAGPGHFYGVLFPAACMLRLVEPALPTIASPRHPFGCEGLRRPDRPTVPSGQRNIPIVGECDGVYHVRL